MPAFIMGGNVMGTALVMEHANALAQMIVSEKDKFCLLYTSDAADEL